VRRLIGVGLAFALIALACTAQGRPATPSHAPTRDERWTQDIDYLVKQMEAIHPDLFHGVSKEAFDRSVEDLVATLPTLSDDQVLVGIMHLVALISSHGRDGHMGVWPPDNPEVVHRFPIRCWEFPDGLFVTAARQPNENLVGTKILSVDGVPIDEVFRRLDPLVPHDNASNLRDARTVFLTSAEVLAGIGIASDARAMELEVETPDGTRRTVTIDAVDADAYSEWVVGWELLLPERPGLLFLQNPTEVAWLRYLAPLHSLYVQYRVVEDDSSHLVDQIRSVMRAHQTDRVVLDLRNNGGGEAGGYRDLLRFLTEPAIDRPGKLVVLIGRLTFSGAVSLAVLLEQRVANVTFVGEASGGAPNFWADTVTITLPNSNLRVLISDRYFGFGGSNDTRLAIEPDIAVALTSSDYFSGRDPVLETAFNEP
jgi:hypothetical protein